MNDILSAARNYVTSGLGILAGVGLYLDQIGAKLPTTQAEVIPFLASLAIAGLGLAAKDARK